MNQKMILCIFLTLCLFFGASIHTHAFSKDWSASKQIKQWQININQAKDNAQKNLYSRVNYFTLDIKNIDEPVSSAQVTAYRNEPTQSTMAAEVQNINPATGRFQSEIALNTNTQKLIIDISWKDAKDGKKHQKRLVFKE